ncbi:2-amino-4-hydroxy-6-hydroxymethyldihydropteridine diphosphokinase [Moheibacter lacus]|uniref:2-amino-4-hydroxy-6-hydroxymethyldihydropteridine pyrophosphokinase n=1 Tax=Moheibacter lacus TaxID=2745851 RepID=A0A838ZQN2_9FLAO|nr:2-amino-4-hydroxy-6-hydroxymethyldihydropteridine diphosphokinase [Moheibacter lacus]MBA5629575.1 2-amino-4-hydroxy-6-hydroxymethyldihydropteridine diphosphokinase [Moheibacter lacus]
MSQNTIQLLLGSNLNDRESNLKTARLCIEKEIGTIEKCSKIIETAPEGFESKYDFLNQIIQLNTVLSPMSILKTIKSIEKKMGRTYEKTDQKYQDRIIDIDLLVFNQIVFESKNLMVPHHQLFSRNFVKKIRI